MIWSGWNTHLYNRLEYSLPLMLIVFIRARSYNRHTVAIRSSQKLILPLLNVIASAMETSGLIPPGKFSQMHYM